METDDMSCASFSYERPLSERKSGKTRPAPLLEAAGLLDPHKPGVSIAGN